MQKMKWMMTIGGLVLISISSLCLGADKPSSRKKILYFSQSEGFRHSMVRRPLTGELAPSEKIFKELATKAGYEVFFSQDFHDLTSKDAYKDYDVVMFYTSGDVKINKEALYEWVKEGGAFVGIHSATDTWKKDQAYVDFIGGAFKTHGAGGEEVTIKIEDPNHPATRMIKGDWKIVDEIYQHVNFSRDNIHVLMSIDTSKTNLKPQKMEPDGDYPIAWSRTEGKGRVFYTALGHRLDVWENPLYQQHLLTGIEWALGKADAK